MNSTIWNKLKHLSWTGRWIFAISFYKNSSVQFLYSLVITAVLQVKRRHTGQQANGLTDRRTDTYGSQRNLPSTHDVSIGVKCDYVPTGLDGKNSWLDCLAGRRLLGVWESGSLTTARNTNQARYNSTSDIRRCGGVLINCFRTNISLWRIRRNADSGSDRIQICCRCNHEGRRRTCRRSTTLDDWGVIRSVIVNPIPVSFIRTEKCPSQSLFALLFQFCCHELHDLYTVIVTVGRTATRIPMQYRQFTVYKVAAKIDTDAVQSCMNCLLGQNPHSRLRPLKIS
jgi:hypothetical protein